MSNNNNKNSIKKSLIQIAFAAAVAGTLSAGISATGLLDDVSLLGEQVESEVSYSTCPEDKYEVDVQRTADGSLKSFTTRCKP